MLSPVVILTIIIVLVMVGAPLLVYAGKKETSEQYIQRMVNKYAETHKQ